MENEYKAAAGEDDELIQSSVDQYYMALEKEASDNNRESVIHDYLEHIGQKEADSILNEKDCVEQFERLLKSGKKRQLIVRVGYGLLEKDKIGPVDYLKILMEILDKDSKSRKYADDDIKALAGYLHVKTGSNAKTKMISRIREVLEDMDIPDGKVYEYLEPLVRSMLDSMMKYQIEDFFSGRRRNAADRKGIDPVFLYIKHSVHTGTSGDDEPIESKIIQAREWCRSFGADTDPNLLIPVVLDQSFTCGIFIAGSNFFQEFYTGSGAIHKKAEDTAHVYAGINIIRMTFIDFTPQDGVQATLEPQYTTYGFSMNMKVEQIINDYHECQEAAESDIMNNYGGYGLSFRGGHFEYSLNNKSVHRDIYMEQAENELSSIEKARGLK